MSDWNKIDDGPPEKDTYVFVYMPTDNHLSIRVDRWVDLHECLVDFSTETVCVGEGWENHKFDEITHWTPLLKPPEDKL